MLPELVEVLVARWRPRARRPRRRRARPLARARRAGPRRTRSSRSRRLRGRAPSPTPRSAEQRHPPREIPGAGRDDAARARDAAPSRRCPAAGSSMKWTTSCASAASKESSGQGSASAAAPLQVGAGHPLGARVEQRRRVGARDVVGAEAAGELLGQDAGAAADVENALSGLDAGEVGEDGRQLARVAAHEAVVCVTRDVEAHAPERIAARYTLVDGPVTDTRAGRRYARLGEEAGRTLYPARRTWRRRRRQYTPPP